MASFLIMMSVLGGVAHGQQSAGKTPNDLAPCPDSPNCVSTKSNDPDRTLAPLPYLTSGRESMDRLVEIVRQMKRTTIVSATPSYLHVEFRSALFRFVDDVDIVVDSTARVFRFRSARRVGESDLGVNRRRVERLAARLAKPATP